MCIEYLHTILFCQYLYCCSLFLLFIFTSMCGAVKATETEIALADWDRI